MFKFVRGFFVFVFFVGFCNVSFASSIKQGEEADCERIKNLGGARLTRCKVPNSKTVCYLYTITDINIAGGGKPAISCTQE